MDGSFLLILLGLGALLAFSDLFSNSSSDDTSPPDENDDDDTPDETTRAPLVMGTQDADLIFSGGGEVVRGWSGDDTLITDGDSTLRGGSGDDTLMSIGGGAFLRGGDGEDTFVIAPVDSSEDGALLNRNGAPVDPTVIADFDPDEDRLVLDLRSTLFLPVDDEPVVLTGVAAPDGDGIMVQVNGVNVVQLSGYGGDDAQAALEAIQIEVVGAAFVFPESEEEETEEERIVRTGIGNDDDNEIYARDDVSVYLGLGGNDTMVGFREFGVTLYGNSGNDLIVAYEDDRAYGGAGGDVLIGLHAEMPRDVQILDGGRGADTLITLGGSTMTGGVGADTFIISPAAIDDDGNFLSIASQTPLPVSVITDFDTERDEIILDLDQTYQRLYAEYIAEINGPDLEPVVFDPDAEVSFEETENGTRVLVDGIAFVDVLGVTPDQIADRVTIANTTEARAA